MPIIFKSLVNNKNFKPVALVIISVLYLTFLISQIIKLNTGSYLIDESKLYKLDTIKLIDKAYLTSNRKGGSKSYEFKDENWFSFVISNRQYNSITEKRFIYDTLQNCNTVLTVYTDKQGYDCYKNGQKSKSISIYQLAVGDRKYIDIEDCNSSEKSKIIEIAIVWLGVYICIFVFIIKIKIRFTPPQ